MISCYVNCSQLLHPGFGFALFIVVSFASTTIDTVSKQLISSAEFWRVVGESGVDGI